MAVDMGYNYNILERFGRKVEEIEYIYETSRGIKIQFKNNNILHLKAELKIRPYEIVPEIEIEYIKCGKGFIINGGKK